MKRLLTSAAALMILAAPVSAFADSRHDDHRDDHRPGPSMMMHGPSHNNWRKGGRIERNDWNRGTRVDYRHYHLSAPPRGYEWRRVDNNYVLAAAATGLIAGLVIAGSN
ncbi:MAG TPA: RcnB family protein [Rhizomicrobium sp.]|jgi:Ni/Co efflux regulator RcnB